MERRRVEDSQIDLRSKYLGVDLVNMLLGPTPSDWIEERPIRGGNVARYVAGYHFTQRLNEAFGFLWNFKVLESIEKDGHIVVKGQLSVRIPGKKMTREFPDGTKEIIEIDGIEIQKEQFGGSDVKRFAQEGRDKNNRVLYKAGDIIDLGDDYKAAATDALKKCAIELGMFLDIYGPRERQEEGKVSKAQLEAFYMRARSAGMDETAAQDWLGKELGKGIGECSPIEVMGLIPKLIGMVQVKR